MTGSGKTIAFLVPAIEMALRDGAREFHTIVLAPTRDLVQQIVKVANGLVKGVFGAKQSI